ncbi:uncharacterized protein LOC133186585 [Saccostrea echinata]|uniref:uncharacterized protein LOC133186585 n=1 Tax=Saccostrea echinata TaxID=191078 RepID=UPI002A80DB20|nr:uncharacterized protein LOC133186585 [Saccostrea echinata]
MSNAEEQKQAALEALKNRIGRRKETPLTVAVIGAPGVGKSSFLNTMITSITGEYREWARTGDSGGTGKPITYRLQWLPVTKYESIVDDNTLEYNFPNFLDIAGFEDTDDEMTQELLNLIFYGRIPYNIPLFKVAEDIRKYGRWYTDAKYPVTPESKKIDRIIFIASATNPNLPTQLMKAVSSVQWRKRDIPLFGVLTNKDRRTENEEDFDQFETKFKTTLGLSHLHYFLCTNYCDDNIEEIRSGTAKNNPELDVPILKFLKQVLDPVLENVDIHREVGITWQNIVEWLHTLWAALQNTNRQQFTIIVVISLVLVVLTLLLF